MRLKYVYLGIASFVITFCLVLTLVIPAFDKRFDVFNLYSKPRQELKPLAENDSAAYTFWYPPANSFGMGVQKTVNWTYWKQWLNNSFYWTSQKSTNKVSWTDASNFLKVNTKYNVTNGTAKISIILNTTGADQNYYYRFMLNCNESLRQNATHPSLYEYDLTLPANLSEDYNISYNFSDLKPLLQQGVITVSHNISNDMFSAIVSTVTRIQPNRLFTIDPTFGYNAGGGTSYSLCSGGTNWYRGSFASPASSGTADNISIVITAYSGLAYNYQCALYQYIDHSSEYARTLIATTEVKTFSTTGTKIFNFSAPKPSVVSGTNYYLIAACVSLTAATTCDIQSTNGGSKSIYNSWSGAYSFPSNLTGEYSSANTYNLLCSYTVSGGGTSWKVISNTINGSIFNASTYTWRTLDTSKNGSIYNSSINAWHVISNTINGSIYNRTGSWKTISTSINGSIYNKTGTWHILSNTINGSICNSSTSSWHILSNTINGSIYNNSGTWHILSNTINGSIYNKTGTWKIISSSINGSIYNISTGGTWHIISNTINGSIFNSSISSWHILSNTINGSIYNVSMGGTWHIISNSINGSIYNMTYPWNIISSNINGSIYNASSPDMIQITNPKPSNNSLQWPINVTLSIKITHLKPGNMNITWYWGNSTANATHYLGSTVNVTNGTYYMHIQPANISFTNFSWKVYVNSGSDTAQAIYNFKTSTKSILFLGAGFRDRFTLGLALGGMLFLVIGMVLWKKRKQ